MNSYSKRVYSTESDNSCPACGKPLKTCRCQNKTQVSGVPADGKIRVSRESKGRKGSGVTLITGLPLSEPELKEMAKSFKRLCGSGGAVKAGVIEIQGEHRDKLLAELQSLGYQALKSGG